jgi:oligopeptide/dipeptide ABC transporter ATP-binding protein
MNNTINIKELIVDYRISETEHVHALKGINLEIKKGESVAIVGESGCGKTTLANVMLNLLPVNAEGSGSVLLNAFEMLNKKNSELEKVRGREAGIIFQEPAASLNPVMTVKEQIEETILAHEPGIKAGELEQRGKKLLEETGIKDIDRVYAAYPHQLSGGQQQRVMTAIALSCNPGILIADEPTTALDVTVQAQIVKLLKKLKEERGLTLVLITHDLHLALELAGRVIVMYAGEIVEDCRIRSDSDARHPYTRALFEIIPDLKSGKKDFKVIPGEVPDMRAAAEKCLFSDRCGRAKDRCRAEHPEIEGRAGHYFRCFYPYK